MRGARAAQPSHLPELEWLGMCRMFASICRGPPVVNRLLLVHRYHLHTNNLHWADRMLELHQGSCQAPVPQWRGCCEVPNP